MKRRACSRLWQVEALRDGALTGRGERDARTHLEVCEDCRAEAASLNSLAARLRECPSRADDLGLRRLRQSTLLSAHGELRARVRGRPRQLRTAAAISFLLGLLAFISIWRWKVQSNGGGSRHRIEIEASNAAVWTRSSIAGIEYVDLADGMLSISVKQASGARLIVRVPDGEIEDVGTRFRVWVDKGRTQQLAVSEGAVVFRRSQRATIELQANRVWNSHGEPDVEPVTSTSATVPFRPLPPSPVVGAPSPSLQPLFAGESSLPSRIAPRQMRPSRGASSKRSEVATSSSSVAVRDMDALEGSDEDLSYLRVIALSRVDQEQARRAAEDYLRRFPNGFRRPEVARVARLPETEPTK